MIAIKKIKKVLKFAGSLIGKIIFSLIAIIVIGLLVYILATTILKSIGKMLGIDDPGMKETADYEPLRNLTESGYNSLMSADELISYYNFEYACLMDAARYLEDTGAYDIPIENSSGLDMGAVQAIAEVVMQNPSILGEGNTLNIDNATVDDYSRWIWALKNTRNQVNNRLNVTTALEGIYSTVAANAGGGNSVLNGTEGGGSLLSNEYTKKEVYYDKVKSETTGEVSLVPYLLIHREWDRLKYRFYDINEETQNNPNKSLESANNSASFIYENIYGLHVNPALNANNVAMQAGPGHENDAMPLELYEKYEAALYYDTAPQSPVTYKIPLKVLIDRYLPKAMLLSAWYTTKSESHEIQELLTEIKDIYSEACLKGETLATDELLVKNIASTPVVEETEISKISNNLYDKKNLLEKYLNGKNTEIVIDGYAPLFDARTLLGDNSTTTSNSPELNIPGESQEDILESTLSKVIRGEMGTQEFEGTELYEDVIDDINLAFAQHQKNNSKIMNIQPQFSLVEEDINREVKKYVEKIEEDLPSLTNYTEELTIYRRTNDGSYFIQCDSLIEKGIHHHNGWNIEYRNGKEFHIYGMQGEHEANSEECLEVIMREHGNPYEENNEYLDCFVPYFKVAIGVEKDESGKKYRCTTVLIFEPREVFSFNQKEKTELIGYAYKVYQRATGDLTNNTSFLTFSRGFAEQTIPLYTNWYSLGKTQELYVVTDLAEVQGFTMPNKLEFVVKGRWVEKDLNDPKATIDGELENYYVTIEINDSNRQEIMEIYLQNLELADVSERIIADGSLVIKRYMSGDAYDLTAPKNAAPKDADYLPNGAGESEMLNGNELYIKLKSENEDLTFNNNGIINDLLAKYRQNVKSEVIWRANNSQGIGNQNTSIDSIDTTKTFEIVSMNITSSSVLPTKTDKLAMFLVEERKCTIGTDVDYKSMPMYFVKSATTWSSKKTFSNKFIYLGQPIDKGNYLYLIQAQRINNGLYEISTTMSAKWRTELYAPIFGGGSARETDILLMLDEWENIGNESPQNSCVYTYMRDLYKLINYSKGVKDDSGNWLIEPVYKTKDVPYVNYNSYTFLNIKDEILTFNETTSEKAYWLDRLLATDGEDAITDEENLEMRNSLQVAMYQLLDYELYPECQSGDKTLVYGIWPLGGRLGRSVITFDTGTKKGLWSILDYGSYGGVGIHGGNDWNGRSNANKIYQSVFGTSYGSIEKLPDDYEAAITATYNNGKVTLHIDKEREYGKEDFKGRYKLSGEPVTINLGGKDYTFKTSASAVYGYELYRLTLIYKSPEKAAKLLRKELEEEMLNTPLIAMVPGYVSGVAATATGGFGVTVVSAPGNASNYIHMKRYPLVQEGQYVHAGTILGYEGTTGNSGGYHIHLEMIDHYYGNSYMFPAFTPFYYEEKSKDENGNLLPLNSEYMSLERTVYPVGLKVEEDIPEGLDFKVLKSIGNVKGDTYVKSIEEDDSTIVIKNYVPSSPILKDVSLLYNETDNIPTAIASKDQKALPIPEVFEPIGGTDWHGDQVKTLELYFDESLIQKVIEEENISKLLAEYDKQAANAHIEPDNDNTILD